MAKFKVIKNSEINLISQSQSGKDKYTHKYVIVPINLNEII